MIPDPTNPGEMIMATNGNFSITFPVNATSSEREFKITAIDLAETTQSAEATITQDPPAPPGLNFSLNMSVIPAGGTAGNPVTVTITGGTEEIYMVEVDDDGGVTLFVDGEEVTSPFMTDDSFSLTTTDEADGTEIVITVTDTVSGQEAELTITQEAP